MRKTFVLVIVMAALIISLTALDDKFIREIYHSETPVANNIKTLDQYAYVYNDWLLYIYNTKAEWNPYIETGFSSTFPMTDIEMLDYNHLYICSHEPTNYISEIDSLNTYGRIYTYQTLVCNKAKREGPLLYTTHRENGLEIYDISKGLVPQSVAAYAKDWGIIDLVARYPSIHALNDYGYVNIDISDLTQPRTIGHNYEFMDGTVLDVERNIAWIGAGNMLIVMELTYPDKPAIINRYSFSAPIMDVQARGNELFVGLKTSGLKILDITNPKFIKEKNSFYLRNGVFSIALDGDYIYLGAGLQGWYILEYR